MARRENDSAAPVPSAPASASASASPAPPPARIAIPLPSPLLSSGRAAASSPPPMPMPVSSPPLQPTPSPSPSPPPHGFPAFVRPELLLRHGKLLRRDRRLFTWKWRDVYLERQRLLICNEKGERKAEIPIASTTPITVRLVNDSKPFGLVVFVRDEKLTLAAATAADRQLWVDALSEAFHANVEDLQTTSATVVERDKRTKPMFLSIPDAPPDGDGQHLGAPHGGAAAAAAGASVGTPGGVGGGPVHAMGHSGDLLASGKVPPPTGNHSFSGASGNVSAGGGAAAVGASGNPNLTDNGTAGLHGVGRGASRSDQNAEGGSSNPNGSMGGGGRGSLHGRVSDSTMGSLAAAAAVENERRSLFRNSEGVLPIEVAQQTRFVPLKEQYSNVTFPRSLASGEVLVGVGPIVRRMGWTDERILAVGLYVDAEMAVQELQRFHGRRLQSLYGDQAFYDYLIFQAKFRRSFVFTSRKRVSKSVLMALLHDEIAPRLGDSTYILETFLSFIEKSLKKAESMVLRINPDGSVEFRLRGRPYPPIQSTLLCQCIQSMFFDVNSIQQDAKRRLVERLPWLWGVEEILDEHLHPVMVLKECDPEAMYHFEGEHDALESESDEDEEEEPHEDADPNEPVASYPRKLSVKEQWDELDEREHEILRRESRSLGVTFGPMVDRESMVQFRGDLLLDGSALLGTWSHNLRFSSAEMGTGMVDRHCIVTIGLYVEPGNASESLLKYKGLSMGSILQDPDFFIRFAEGAFTKHLVFKVSEAVAVSRIIDYFTARVRRRGSGVSINGPDRSKEARMRSLMDRLNEPNIGKLKTGDVMRITIQPDNKMSLSINREADKGVPVLNTGPRLQPVDDFKLATAPESTVFQGIFYGYHTTDPSSRSQLMERLPSLLDLAKDDLAHTYHDEIQLLKENYKRQLPELRLKAGYLLIAFEKRKMARNAEGIKEPTITASKWSKRWCRLDGTKFSYFSHKRSKRARDLVDLTQCKVVEITTASTLAEIAPFTAEKGGSARPSIRIGVVKPNGEVVALKTESIYEGVEWLDSLVEASRVRKSLEPHRLESPPHESDEDAQDGETDNEDDEDVDSGEDDTPDQYCDDAISSITTDSKHGSLLAWTLEDSRHAFIMGLIIVIAWLVTRQPPEHALSAVSQHRMMKEAQAPEVDPHHTDPDDDAVEEALQGRFQQCQQQSTGTDLDLSNLHLREFPREVMTLFPSIRRLNLRKNAIVEIPVELCRHLTHLTALNFADNALTALPDEFGNLKTLQRLSLAGNSIQRLPSSFSKLHNLEELDLSGNRLCLLDGDLGTQLLRLRTLQLANNQLTEIPSSFSQLMALRVVDLRGNDELVHVPEAIRRLHERNVILHSREKRRELITRALRVRNAVHSTMSTTIAPLRNNKKATLSSPHKQ